MNNAENIEETVILQGVVGFNCGIVENYNGSDKRLLEKGFVVNNGIPTLRGFAKISDLAAVSRARYNEYQREKNEKHVKEIEMFLDHCKDEAKFLPEVVLSISEVEKVVLQKLQHKSLASISTVAKGVIENLDYYIMEVKGVALSRVDGNHRLEAGKDKDYYIPFSVVLWNIDLSNKGNLLNTSLLTQNLESEAFLFYLLNNTARKLELEENYKGLVKSQNWTEKELSLINWVLPLIKFYDREYGNNQLAKNNWLFAPLSQIGEILLEINDREMDIGVFNTIFCDVLKLLSQENEFEYVKSEFRSLFFQLAFYARYKNNSYDETKGMLKLIDKWLKTYKYTSLTFTKATKIYDVAIKFLHVSPKYIFVAMEYKSEDIVEKYNGCLKRAVDYLNDLDSNIEVDYYPIMTGEGKSINITHDIYSKIDECSIFIADITEANPNVMYELGIAYSKGKPIILLREKGKKIRVPSDIISEYRYAFSDLYDLENLLIRHVRTILEKEYGAIFQG